MLDIICAIIIGIICGIITGIIPALHVNTVGIIIFSISDKILAHVNIATLTTFFIAIAITHAMFEFIPSLLVAIPQDDTVMSIQPAHRLIFKSKACEVIRCVSFGGYLSIIILIILMPLLFMMLPPIYGMLHDYIGYLLIVVMIIILYNSGENKIKKLTSTLIFLTSGILGVVMLGGNVNSNLSLLCMLSGLFSVSSLIYYFNSNSQIPPQDEIHSINVNFDFIRSAFAGSISGCILGLLPGLGPAQGSVIAQVLTFNSKVSSRDFLITNSGVNISDTLFSIIAIFLIGNPRSAISVYVATIIGDVTFNYIIFFIFVCLICVSVSCIISIKVGDFLISKISNINYRKLNTILIVAITLIVIIYCIYTSECIWYVLICYTTSVALGIIVNVVDLNKTLLMGVLIIPSIVIYLGLF